MIAEALLCLTLNVYHEARGEPFLGQVAVAEVTLNRVDDLRWPDTVCEVVYQPYQFSWTLEDKDPPADLIAFHRAKQAAEYAMENRSNTCLLYTSPSPRDS